MQARTSRGFARIEAPATDAIIARNAPVHAHVVPGTPGPELPGNSPVETPTPSPAEDPVNSPEEHPDQAPPEGIPNPPPEMPEVPQQRQNLEPRAPTVPLI